MKPLYCAPTNCGHLHYVDASLWFQATLHLSMYSGAPPPLGPSAGGQVFSSQGLLMRPVISQARPVETPKREITSSNALVAF